MGRKRKVRSTNYGEQNEQKAVEMWHFCRKSEVFDDLLWRDFCGGGNSQVVCVRGTEVFVRADTT